MITLNASGGSVSFTFSGNSTYLNDGVITCPVNSLALIIDESDMISFKKANSNDLFVSANIAEFGMTKAELESWFKANAVGSTGGGGGVTPSEVQTMIDESVSGKADSSAVTEEISAAVSGYADAVAYDSNTKAVKFYHGGTGGTEVYNFDASPFLIDGMVQNVEIKSVEISGVATTCLVISFNTDAGKQDINIPISQIFDANNYYTTAQTDSAISAAISGKADTSYVDQSVSGKASQSDLNTLSGTVTAHTADTDIHVTTSDKSTWNAKQDALVSGTNIKTINNESILGSGNIDIQSGGGKAVSAGTNISITTGETADTINCTLPISADTNTISINKKNVKIGTSNVTTSNLDRLQIAIGDNVTANGIYSFAFGVYAKATNYSTVSMGYGTESNIQYQASFGQYNVSSSASTTFGDSGNTLFSVGNGTANNARHNAFEIRQNGDIYLSSGGTDIKLQDHLGANVVQTTGTSTTDVMSQDTVTTQLNGKGDAISFDMVGSPRKKVTFLMKSGGKNGTTINSRDLTLGRGLVYGEEGSTTLSTSGLVETSAVTSAVTSGSTDVLTSGGAYEQFGGLKLVKLTESEYTALVTKDPNVLYVVIPDPSNP